jgi:uncharacterized protein YlxW (UPF0749 family)
MDPIVQWIVTIILVPLVSGVTNYLRSLRKEKKEDLKGHIQLLQEDRTSLKEDIAELKKDNETLKSELEKYKKREMEMSRIIYEHLDKIDILQRQVRELSEKK